MSNPGSGDSSVWKRFRIVGGAVGGAGVIWGAVLAALDGQPGFVMAAGFGLVVLGMVGADWSEFAAKFGDVEMRVKRRVEEVVQPALDSIKGAKQDVMNLPGLSNEMAAALAGLLEDLRFEMAVSLLDPERKVKQPPPLELDPAEDKTRQRLGLDPAEDETAADPPGFGPDEAEDETRGPDEAEDETRHRLPGWIRQKMRRAGRMRPND